MLNTSEAGFPGVRITAALPKPSGVALTRTADGRRPSLGSIAQHGKDTGLLISRKRALAAATALGLVFAVLPPRAFAADPSATAVPPSVAEVVITAQKRTSTVLKTPVSITAVTGADLQNRGLTSAQAAIQAVPGIAVSSAGPGQAQYEIRGLSADAGEAPTIGFYLNETSITPPASATSGKSEIDPDLYDLARVEVLRGPQGTLYGAGSLGGTVKLVTNPPDFSGFYGSAQTSLSGTDGGGLNYSAKAMVNVPIVADKVALRVVGIYDHDSGWINRVVVPDFPPPNADGSRGDVEATPASTVHHGVNDENLEGVRAALLIRPTADLTITPAIFFQHTYQGGLNAYDSVPGNTLSHYEPFDVAEPYTDNFTVYSLTAAYALKPFTVTSVTSYWDRKSSQFEDQTEQDSDALGLTSYSVASGGIGPSQASEYDTTHEFSQEVRLSSNGSGRFQWIVGGFYSSFFDEINLSNTLPGLLTAGGGVFGASNLVHVVAPLNVTQEAGFVHLSYEFVDGFKLEAGGRYFTYQNKQVESADGLLYGGSVVNTTAAAASGINPMVNLSWSPDSKFMLYASASKGFREGAGNPVVPTAASNPEGAACESSLQSIGLTSAPTAFGPDTDWSYEVGEKARLFDNRVTLNSDVFYIVWSKVQQPVALSCGLAFTDNGPDATVRGGEAEFKAELIRGLTLSQSVGYAYAAFSEAYAPAGIVKGQTLYDAPRWTLSSNLRYEHPLGSLTLVAEAQNSFQSTSRDASYEINNVGSRDFTNIRAGLETAKWSAYAFVNNVFNVHANLEYMNLLIITGPNFNRIATNQPLTAGIELNKNF